MSGNGNHAIVYGSSPTQNLQGDSSTAYSFDGIDDNINIGVKPSIQITGNLTISVWIKIEDYNGNIQSIINCQADNTDNIETNALYSIYFSNNNKYLTYTHESGNGLINRMILIVSFLILKMVSYSNH
ncbi:MAG: hypothetical protein H6613_17155 [Ignavibacteriales bacterium]|nr:hypothetical protein [Ignavibacteriales bacterium]